MFPNLLTLHVMQCDDLRHVFVVDDNYKYYADVLGVDFLKLTTIRLHGLPMLQQISVSSG